MWSDPDAHYKVAHLPEWTPDCPTTGFCRFSTGQASDASGSKMTIFIEVKDAHGKNSLALATAYEQKLRGDRKTYPNYRRLNLRWKTPGQYTGAVHEFTFDHPLNGPRHVLVFRTVTGGLSYELSLNGPADQFDAARSVFDDMVRSLVIFK
jgi:hypothetical protein